MIWRISTTNYRPDVAFNGIRRYFIVRNTDRRNKSTHLSHLACFSRSRVRPEIYEMSPFYVSIDRSSCPHLPWGCTYRLMYSQNRNIVECQCLVEDVGAKITGFQDVEALGHLWALAIEAIPALSMIKRSWRLCC
jgi:hypothetical protein